LALRQSEGLTEGDERMPMLVSKNKGSRVSPINSLHESVTLV